MPFSYETAVLMREQLNSRIYLAEPSDIMLVELPDGRCFMAPEGETEDAIIDRIHRSVQEGRNLFAEEWQAFHADNNVKY